MSKASDEALQFFKNLPEHEKTRAIYVMLKTLANEVKQLEKKLEAESFLS